MHVDWIKHCDTIFHLSMNEEAILLYSSSWDRTFKVSKMSNSRCLEFVKAHDDMVNSVILTTEGFVLTESMDGFVKVSKREGRGKSIKHIYVHTLLHEDSVVMALVVSTSGAFVYCGT
ncbi:hypothetical protein L6452_22893 [Arctium lappa]|uniref:Uncharacterized protein n=1 Tax=Arctium lappa TaxID=4217 RepID=A0ACB9B068_ARCLA|nr:hypothetical protein L6452_22893 [Arctium lappa]